ncbi:MAG: RNA methyltransferase [Candidatus Omnitrophica bacterium]|nr:RNA methyltransferase [Candidatus Omnitrophota bacterium]MCB9720614.1 RNA methyltransferase [Candidatus Omnitrophota bacterium]
MRKISHAENLVRQQQRRRLPRLPLTVVLNNIRSLHNVGSILRTCDGVGVEKVWICGITGCPPNNQIHKTALGAEDSVDWEYAEDILRVIADCRACGEQIVVLEQTETSVAHDEFLPGKKVCLIIGNEVEGVQQEVADLGDASVEIEMAGVKNSLNVAVAFGVVAYQLRTRMKS